MYSLVLVLLVLFPVAAHANLLIGGDTVYIVQSGDTLERIGARFGVNWRSIATENNLDFRNYLQIGQELKINTRKIVPKFIDNGIIINIPDRTLYYFRNSTLEKTFPVGLGRPPAKGKRNWTTPHGPFSIVRKDKNPSWYVPLSIQQEMAEEGKPVQTIVPPGPDNPLGRFSLRTSIPAILIHETIWPGTVYQFRSHGCIRVLPEHMEDFFHEVELNTQGELIYNVAKIAVSDDGRIFLEIHNDIYGKISNLSRETESMIKNLGLSEQVNWQKVELMLRNKSGTAEDISL